MAPLSEAARISEVTVGDSYDAAIGTLRDWLRDAKQVVVLTGAGISTDLRGRPRPPFDAK